MGVDAFWFCDNCKIEYQPKYYGGRQLLAASGAFGDPPLTWQEIDNWLVETKKLLNPYSSAWEDYLVHLEWFAELRDFLKRHEGHKVHLLDDAGGFNFGEYKDERGIVWSRGLDYVEEGGPTPNYPKYSTGWHAMVDIERLQSGENTEHMQQEG